MLAHLAGAWVLEMVRFAGVLVAAVRACVRAGGQAHSLLQYVGVCVGPRAPGEQGRVEWMNGGTHPPKLFDGVGAAV